MCSPKLGPEIPSADASPCCESSGVFGSTDTCVCLTQHTWVSVPGLPGKLKLSVTSKGAGFPWRAEMCSFYLFPCPQPLSCDSSKGAH